jgi:hypothetical protein
LDVEHDEMVVVTTFIVKADSRLFLAFARYDLPHRGGPAADFDMASAGVVKVLEGQSGVRDPLSRRYPDMAWEPKAAFDVVADWFGR